MDDGDRYIAQDRRPASVDPVDPAALTPRARALLFLPDLVTDFLEASFGESITVTCLSRSVRSDLVDLDLGAGSGDSVVVRESAIHGANSRRPFIHAQVRLAEAMVPPDLVKDLKDLSVGLGRLLDKHEVVCEDEMLWYGLERAETMSLDLSGILEGDQFVARCYRLVTPGGVVAALVERFSVDLFSKEE
jgi:chorismate-pyruvate lyase